MQAVCANGSVTRGIELGVEIAQRAEKTTGLPVLFATGATGSYGSVGWFTGYVDIGELERAQQALAVDAKFQADIEARVAQAGIKPPDTYVLEHGYCRSVYVTDPNGLILEFTLDHPDVEKIARTRRADAHQELKRWLAGDHTSNNMFR